MIFRNLFFSLFLYTSSFASFEELRIGEIDDYYKDKITQEELISIIKEIETLFETKLQTNIFDYSTNGKPIDILYVLPSKLENDITKKIDKLNEKKNRIEELKSFFPPKKEEINQKQQMLNEHISFINQKIEVLNSYVREVNSKKTVSKEEFLKIQNYVKLKKEEINKESNKKITLQNDLTIALNSHNQKVIIYNNLINDINRLSNEIESMGRNVKKINGRTFGLQEITLKTYFKDGQEIQEKSIKNSMNKIEIYGFDSKEQLKVVLAHEIAHLVGIPHIEVKDALMNPILQENQIKELNLTKDDIENFRKNF